MYLSRQTEQYYPQVVGLLSTGALYDLVHPLELSLLDDLGLGAFGILGFLFSFSVTGFCWVAYLFGTTIQEKPEVLPKLEETGVLPAIQLYSAIMVFWFLNTICATLLLFVLLLREPTTAVTNSVLIGGYVWYFVYVTALLSYVRVYWIARALQN